MIISNNWELSIEALKNIHRLSESEFLCLADTNANDEVLTCIIRDKIVSFDISFTSITDSGIFASVSQCQNLKFLDITATEITVFMKEIIHFQIPDFNIKIDFNDDIMQ